MNMTLPRTTGLLARLCVWFALVVSFSFPAFNAQAHWLSKLAREAGDVGGGAARHVGHGIEGLGGISRHLKSLPRDADSVALAAHATPEGHWKFSNAEGEVFTAASAEEMARVVKALAPEHAGKGNLKLYLTEDTVFARPYSIKGLPADAELHLLADNRSYRLLRDSSNASRYGFLAEIRPGLQLRLADKSTFDEALWQLKKPLTRSSIRVVALEPGASPSLSIAPRFDSQSKAALIDKVDPWKLTTSLSSIRGQTLVVTGRIDGEFMYFRPASGGEKSILIGDLKRAAKDWDVNLVVLQAADPLQPGGRNWFWQKVEVKGLDEALKRAEFADFLDVLGRQRENMVIEARRSAEGRMGFDVSQGGAVAGTNSNSLTGTMSSWGESVYAQVLGNVITSSINADLVDKERQRELDLRIVPNIPSIVQFVYLGAIVLGLIGISLVKRWWARIWPVEKRSEYAGAFGYYAARTVRFLLLSLVFLPLAGVPAGLWVIGKGIFDQVWFYISLPFRILRWLWRRIVPA